MPVAPTKDADETEPPPAKLLSLEGAPRPNSNPNPEKQSGFLTPISPMEKQSGPNPIPEEHPMEKQSEPNTNVKGEQSGPNPNSTDEQSPAPKKAATINTKRGHKRLAGTLEDNMSSYFAPAEKKRKPVKRVV